MLDRALADCNQALKLRPNDATILDSRAFTYLKMGRYKEALRDYDAALTIAPRAADSLFGRGVVHGCRVERRGRESTVLQRRWLAAAGCGWPRPIDEREHAAGAQHVARADFEVAER